MGDGATNFMVAFDDVTLEMIWIDFLFFSRIHSQKTTVTFPRKTVMSCIDYFEQVLPMYTTRRCILVFLLCFVDESKKMKNHFSDISLLEHMEMLHRAILMFQTFAQCVGYFASPFAWTPLVTLVSILDIELLLPSSFNSFNENMVFFLPFCYPQFLYCANGDVVNFDLALIS